MVEATDNLTDETLTLHERISARWQGERPIGGTAVQPMVTSRAEALIDALPGLASMGGGFGGEAFDIASLLAMESRFSYALSPELRAMSIGDLADIVQVVLEEEEAVLEALEAQVREAKTQQARAAAAKRLKAAQKSTAKKRASRGGIGQKRRVNAVRQAIAKVRAEAARLRRALPSQAALPATAGTDLVGDASGATGQNAGGVSTSIDVGTMGYSDPGGEDAFLPGIGESLRVLREQSSLATYQTRLGHGGDVSLSAADYAANVAADHTATRALRLAEWTADMAVLQPAEASSVFVGDLSDAAGPRSPVRVDTSASAPSVLAPAASVMAPQLSKEQQSAWRASEQLATQHRIHRAASAPNATPAAGVMTPQRRTHLARLALAQAPTVRGAAPAASHGTAARAPVVAPATPAPALNGLQGALRLSAATLRRHASVAPAAFGPSSLAPHRGVDATPRQQPGVDATTPLAQTNAAAPFVAALNGGADPFASLLSRTGGVVPALAHSVAGWLERSDDMLRGGAAAMPSHYDTVGGGETLNLGAADVTGVEPTTSAAAVRATTASRGTGAGAPAWIAPHRARQAVVAPAASAASPGVAERLPSGPATRPATTLAPSILGGGAVEAFRWASQLTDRHVSGLMPVAAPTAWQPPATAASQGTASPVSDAVPAPGSRAELRALSGVTGIPEESLSRMGAAAVAQMRGVLAAQAGAGEWLLPGDAGYEDWSAQQSAQAAFPSAKPPKTAPSAAEATRPGMSRAAAGPTGQRDRAGATPHAAAAAIQAALAGHERLASVARLARTVGAPTPMTVGAAPVAAQDGQLGASAQASSPVSGTRSILDFAGGGLSQLMQSALGVAPGGAADAVTPWILQRAMERLSPEARSALWLDGVGAGDFVSLDTAAEDADFGTPATPAQGGAAAEANVARDVPSATAPSTSTASTPTRAASKAAQAKGSAGALTPTHRALLRRLAAPGSALGSSLGSAALDLRQPVALRAALALFGEASGGGADVADAFLTRFFGRAAAPQTGGADLGDSLTHLSVGPDAQAAIGAGSTGAGARVAGASGQTAMAGRLSGVAPTGGDDAEERLVFSGLAGLAAIREMKGAGLSETELLELGQVERTSTTSGASAADVTTGAASARTRKDKLKGGTAAQIHRFAPAGLSRTRQLLDGRRGRRVANRSTTSRVGHSRMGPNRRGYSRFGRSRVGYGAAGLGGGALLGLMPGDEGGLAETYGGTSATRRAERLGAAVQARRAPRPGQVLRPMPRGNAERTYVSNTAQGGGTAAGPGRGGYAHSPAAGFTGGEVSELVSPVSAMQAVASSAGSSAGTSGIKQQQASAMARVLSVTASPSANVLPLVAPAARAVVAQAAAKPMSESIATSGYNPTAALQSTGQQDGQQAGGSGMGGSAQERQDAGGQPAQELNALAMKVARSVLVRIKRERERRGIYG